jgi:uncharacterized membrane protein
MMWLIAFNGLSRGILGDGSGREIAAFALLIALNLIAVYRMYDLLRRINEMTKQKSQLQPLLLSGFAVFLLIQSLVVQASLGAASPVLTLIFGLTAICWILYGFIKRNNIARICGLVIVCVAVVKLFVLDLHNLETTLRIISYFTGGVVLLAISFTYQWFSKRLEPIN